VVIVPDYSSTGLGSIPGATIFSEKSWVWNGVHSALVKINEELLKMKVATRV
jgi:hypothetical protein